jgi:hypothetical protein
VKSLGLVLVLAACGDDRAVPDAAGADAAPDAIELPAAVDPAWPEVGDLPAAFDLPPWLTVPAPDRISIGWQSVAEATGWVELVAAPDGRIDVDWSAARRLDSPASRLHHVELADLPRGVAYRYRVHVDDPAGEAVREGVFVTPGAERWRFLHLGEFHAPTSSREVRRFTPQIREFRPHVVIESGDMVDDGDQPGDWRAYLQSSAPWISNVVLLPVHSNHVNGAMGNPFILSLFELPDNERWYSTRLGRIEVVTLDSTFTDNFDTRTEPQWIRARMATLAAEPVPPRVIAAWHFPACSSTFAARTAQRRWVLDNFVAAFADTALLALVLVGHDKYYERSQLAIGDRTITHIMVNSGHLAPGAAGGNEPECTPVVTDTTRRTIGLMTVDGVTIAGQVVDQDARIVDEVAIE